MIPNPLFSAYELHITDCKPLHVYVNVSVSENNVTH